MATPKTMKIPKTLGAAVDLMYKKRDERLALQKQVDTIKKDEYVLSEHLIQIIAKDDAKGVTGKKARAKIITTKRAAVADWGKFYKHVKKTGDFSLLQRRVNDAHARALWDDGKKIPGVEVFNAVKVSLTKA